MSSTRRGKLKGQFFILGALALTIAFYLGLNIPESVISPRADDMVFFAKNLKKDLPMALNFGLNESAGLQALDNFTLFTKDVIEGHYIDYSLVWFVVEGTPSEEANITFGNYWGTELTVNMSISGALPSVHTITVPNNSTDSVLFTFVPPTFTFSAVLGDEGITVELVRDKISLYSLLQLKRGENIVREEIVS